MNLEKYIDHTNLKQDAIEKDIIKLCEEAKEYNFASVCVNPCWIKLAQKELKNSEVKVCTVIGFPLGQNSTNTKVYETKNAIETGADEIDMVINVGQLKMGNDEYILNEINQIKAACNNKILKVIVETCLLNEEEKIRIANIVKTSNADFIKTSTGFSTDGANKEDIELFNSILGESKKIKASGGVKNFNDSMTMINAGASRIGTSGGCQIINGEENQNKY